MVVGAVIAFLVIFGLFLSMLSGSPGNGPETEWSPDTDTGQEFLTPGQFDA